MVLFHEVVLGGVNGIFLLCLLAQNEDPNPLQFRRTETTSVLHPVRADGSSILAGELLCSSPVS